MSIFHEIWDRPDADSMQLGWAEMRRRSRWSRAPNANRLISPHSPTSIFPAADYRGPSSFFSALRLTLWRWAGCGPWTPAPVGAGASRPCPLRRVLREIKKGKRAYIAEGTFTKIEHAEILGWVAFAEGKQDEAFANMRTAADLQDKVGQAEVDIPAREMLADMLLESGHAQQALSEYEIASQAQPEPVEWPLQRRPCSRGCGRAVEGAVLLRGADEIHKQRPKLHPPRANTRQAVRLRHPVGKLI